VKRKYVKKSAYWTKFKKQEEKDQIDFIEENKNGEDQEGREEVQELRETAVEV
jgi:hypothetical protein